MEVTGRIINGTIVPDERIDWPERSSVRIILEEDRSSGDLEQPPGGPTLYDQLQHLIGKFDGPEDMSRNHDHYLYGTQKRKP